MTDHKCEQKRSDGLAGQAQNLDPLGLVVYPISSLVALILIVSPNLIACYSTGLSATKAPSFLSNEKFSA